MLLSVGCEVETKHREILYIGNITQSRLPVKSLPSVL